MAKRKVFEAVINAAAELRKLGGTYAERMARAAQQGVLMADDGAALRVYHATTDDIPYFDKSFLGGTTGAPSAKKAFFFASNPDNANFYAQYEPEHFTDYAVAKGRQLTGNTDKTYKAQREAMGAFYDEIGTTSEKVNDLYYDINEIQDDLTRKAVYDAAGINDDGIRLYDEAQRQIISLKRKEGGEKYSGIYSLSDMKYAIDDGILSADDMNSVASEASDLVAKKTATLWDELAALGKADAAKQLIDLSAKKKEYSRFLDSQAWSKKSWAGGAGDEAWDATRKAWQPNVIPAHLKMDNPFVHDFGGAEYRNESYSDLIDQAIAGGHDGVIFKNTADPYPTDVYAVFEPNQIRSVNADFNPEYKDSSNLLAGIAGVMPYAGATAAALAGATGSQEAEAGPLQSLGRAAPYLTSAALGGAAALQSGDAEAGKLDALGRAAPYLATGALGAAMMTPQDAQAEPISIMPPTYNDTMQRTQAAINKIDQFKAKRAGKRGAMDQMKLELQTMLKGANMIANDVLLPELEKADGPLKLLLGFGGVFGALAQGKSPAESGAELPRIMAQPADQTTYELGGRVTDTLSPYVPAPVAAGAGALTHAGALLASPF